MQEAIHLASRRFNSGETSPMSSVMEQFAVTDRAAARIAEIVAETKPAPNGSAEDVALRVAVLAGGCSGFQYRFELDGRTQDDDVVIRRGPARVVVDAVSMDLLSGSELDYTDELMGSHFAVRNPNAKSACGCGTSFSLD
jgi:iron-sulfur cluster insertion protein